MYEEIKEEIIKHEGKINKVYLDHLGNATFGVGHLVLPTESSSLKPTKFCIYWMCVLRALPRKANF